MKIAVIGAGLYGSTIAHLLKQDHDVYVYEQSNRIGGNVQGYYDEKIGCHVSEHGAHIFHTNSLPIWSFMNLFSDFNQYRHYVKGATSDGRVLDLPFGMSLFSQVLGLKTPREASLYFNNLRGEQSVEHHDIESWCKQNIGATLYNLVVKNYTEKQWGRPCSELPSDIIRRLPMRFDYDNTYFNTAKYQGMPVLGYQTIMEKMLSGVTVHTGCRIGFPELTNLHKVYDVVYYSGALDALFDYSEGALPYRGLKFENAYLSSEYSLGAPVINDLTLNTFTRRIDHKMFYKETNDTGYRLITTEFPSRWEPGQHPYYPIRDQESSSLYNNYQSLAEDKFPKMIVGGRLGAFRYYDMDQVIGMAMVDAKKVSS